MGLNKHYLSLFPLASIKHTLSYKYWIKRNFYNRYSVYSFIHFTAKGLNGFSLNSYFS